MSRYLVVGSSPLLLLDAGDLAAAGHEVEVIERAVVLGGAWATTDFHGFHGVEIGCHLLEREAAGYARLAAAGVELEPMLPAPMNVLRPGVRRSYVSPTAAALRLAYQPLSWARARGRGGPGEWRRRGRLAAKELRDAMVDPSPVLAPVGGAAAMVARLAERVTGAGGVIRTGVKVERLDFCDGASSTIDGDTSVFDVAVVSSALDPALVTVDGRPVSGQLRTREYEHRVFALEAGTVEPHSYWRFSRDPVIQRSSLITANVEGGAHAPTVDLLLVSVRVDPPIPTPAVIARLVEHGILESGVAPLAEKVVRYRGADANAALASALDGRRDAVVRRSFGDLTRSIVTSPRLATTEAVSR